MSLLLKTFHWHLISYENNLHFCNQNNIELYRLSTIGFGPQAIFSKVLIFILSIFLTRETKGKVKITKSCKKVEEKANGKLCFLFETTLAFE